MQYYFRGYVQRIVLKLWLRVSSLNYHRTALIIAGDVINQLEHTVGR